MLENFGNCLNKSIIATNKKYPDRNMSTQILFALKKYIQVLDKNKANYSTANEFFCSCFTKEDKDTKEKVRKKLKDSTGDVAITLLDYIYEYSLKILSRINVDPDEKINMTLISVASHYAVIYANLVSEFGKPNLRAARDMIYDNPSSILFLYNSLVPLMDNYVEEKLKESKRTIKIKEVTDDGKQLFCNIKDADSFIIHNSYRGIYKTGNVNIQMASALGYKTRTRPQQDAIFSESINGFCINIVADGAGGSNMGQAASTITVEGLKRWFESKDFSVFKNISPDDEEGIKKAASIISDSLDRELKRIDEIIKDKYEGSYSTVVVSIVTPGFILFANAGDSTAYVYNDSNNSLKEKSVLDSRSRGLSYEDARHNPTNNQITNAMGILNDDIHYRVMPNKGSYRIILSSDGITDLISKDNFELFTKYGLTADNYVDKAYRYPDISKGMKSEDNISAIVIDSDEYVNKRKVR